MTASDDSTGRVWDAQAGLPLTEPLKHGGSVSTVRFSPDGGRVVTASADRTVRVWDSRTGQALTEPLKHGERVYSAEFSPDGKRVVTASADRTARVWDLAPSPKSHPAWLLTLAEALSAESLNNQGVVEASRFNQAEAVAQIRETLNREPDDGGWVTWGRWVLAHPAKRTISPFSRITVREYIERRIQGDSMQDLEEALPLAARNEELLLRIAAGRPRLEQIEQARTLEKQVNALRRNGKWPEAETACRKTLEIRKKIFGEENRDVAETLSALASVLRQQNKLTEAATTYWEALAIRKNLFGNKNYRTMDTLSALANCLQDQGKYSDAEGPLREIITIRLLSMDRSDANFIRRLVFLLRQQGKLGEVQTLYGELIKGESRDLLNEIAWELATSNDPKLRDGTNAVAIAEKAVVLTNRKDPLVLDTLAAAHAEVGQFEKAGRIQKEAIALLNDVREWKTYEEGCLSRPKLYESNTPYREE